MVRGLGERERVDPRGDLGHTFRVEGSGFRVQGPGFLVLGSGFRVQGSGFRVQGPGLTVQGVCERESERMCVCVKERG